VLPEHHKAVLEQQQALVRSDAERVARWEVSTARLLARLLARHSRAHLAHSLWVCAVNNGSGVTC
jgi:hypothetical protein